MIMSRIKLYPIDTRLSPYPELDRRYTAKEVKGSRVAKRDIDRVEPDSRIAEVVSRHRQKQGLSKEELARRSGVSVWTIYKIEHGERGIGTASLGRLGKVLGLEFEHELLGILAEV